MFIGYKRPYTAASVRRGLLRTPSRQFPRVGADSIAFSTAPSRQFPRVGDSVFSNNTELTRIPMGAYDEEGTTAHEHTELIYFVTSVDDDYGNSNIDYCSSTVRLRLFDFDFDFDYRSFDCTTTCLLFASSTASTTCTSTASTTCSSTTSTSTSTTFDCSDYILLRHDRLAPFISAQPAARGKGVPDQHYSPAD